ncbi:MAG TPA: type IX secretion system membrane protein PorP/SprF [Cytophagales bacterium]|nr:type IX secretion system membrane protein PorP/SprF [Cytophagales bacterium]
MGKFLQILSFKALILGLMLTMEVSAQDPQLSQYYSAPLYLNPAFTGTARSHRLTANYRRQWPSISSKFNTAIFSYDYFHKKWNSGFGVMFLGDQAGEVQLASYSANFLYSYMVRIDRHWVVRAGLNFGFNSRTLDDSKLIFGDQLILGSKHRPPTHDDQFGKNFTSNYFDVGSGIFIYSQKYWLGFAASHLNEPNQSMGGNKSSLPIKYNFHGGARIPLYNGPIKRAKVPAVAPSFLYKKQGRFDQLDLGINFYYQPMMFGLWYRGIPVQKQAKFLNQDAIVLLFGFKYDDFSIGYSYDFTVSKLGPSSGGAHELSLSYELYSTGSSKRKKPRRRDMFMPCPTFMK